MKSNIRRVNINGYTDSNGRWWLWDEVCDNCGRDTGQSMFIHSEKPNTEEKDYCVSCFNKYRNKK